MALADILPQLPQDLDTTQNLARNDNILPNTAAPPPPQGSCCQVLTGPRGSPHRPGGSVGTLFLLSFSTAVLGTGNGMGSEANSLSL